MSQVYKCDRCGNIFDIIETDLPDLICNIWYQDQYYRRIDLCPDCILDLKSCLFYGVKPNDTIIETEDKKIFDKYNIPVDGMSISHKKPQGVTNLLKRALGIYGGEITYNDLFGLTVEQCVECRGLGIHAYFQILNHIDKIGAMEHMRDERHARNFQRYLEKGENTTWKVLMKGV